MSFQCRVSSILIIIIIIIMGIPLITLSSYVTVTVSAPPDLTVSLDRPRQTTFAPGERFTLDATIYNEGTGAAGGDAIAGL